MALLIATAASSRLCFARFLSATTSEIAVSIISEICGVSGTVSIMALATLRF